MERHARLFREELVPALAKEGIELVRWDDLDREEQKYCKRLFKERVFPVLTPLAVDPAHPFPYISGLSLNLAVLVRNPKTGKEHFARVKVPPIFSRFVPLGNQRFVPLEDVIGEHLKRLFPGMEVLEVHTFRVTRNEDLEVEEDDAENLLKALEKELLRRRFGPPVRLEVEESIAPQVLELLDLRARRHRGRGRSGCPGRSTCAACTTSPTSTARGPEVPRVRARRPTRSWPRSSRPRRSTCSRRPGATTYCCTTPTTRSPRRCSASSSRPPPTRTCWRSSRRSTAPPATPRSSTPSIDAAEAGKQVLVIVEIKARFDEEANIRWARKLEQAGCHVVYGLVGPEDPLQAGDGGARRARGHPPLHPHRHRQLQPARPRGSTRTSGCSPPTR